jgi:argonaute-like protein implicated in RNA metabolism and viral defense
MKRIRKIKEITEDYIILDGKEFLVDLNYNQHKYTEFDVRKTSERRSSLIDALTYDELNEINQKEKRELINKLALEVQITKKPIINHEK